MIRYIARKHIHAPLKKSSLGFHMVPYHLQYESRDFTVKNIDNPSAKKEINRKFFIKEFNPYLRSSVSENLSQDLKDFYSQKYSQR